MGRPMKFLREFRLLLLAATNREGGVARFRLKRRTEPFSSGHGLRVYWSLRFLDARIGHFVRAARLLTGEQMDTVEPTYRGFTAKIIPRVT